MSNWAEYVAVVMSCLCSRTKNIGALQAFYVDRTGIEPNWIGTGRNAEGQTQSRQKTLINR